MNILSKHIYSVGASRMSLVHVELHNQFLTRRHEVNTKFTIRLGESIVNFVEYLGGFVLKKVTC